MHWLDKLRNRMDALGLRQVWRVIVFVIGATVVLIGVVMIVLPGPASLIIPAGLAILAIEFAWARRWLHRTKALFKRGIEAVQGQTRPKAASPEPPLPLPAEPPPLSSLPSPPPPPRAYSP